MNNSELKNATQTFTKSAKKSASIEMEEPRKSIMPKRQEPPVEIKPLKENSIRESVEFNDPNMDKKEPEDKKPTYSQEELLAIFDEILFAGEYTEQIIIKGKLPVVFRSRTAKEMEEVSRVIDSLGANLYVTIEQKRASLNLTYGLARYKDVDLTMMPASQKAEFIGQLPAPMMSALITELSKFDEKVFAACVEADKNF